MADVIPEASGVVEPMTLAGGSAPEWVHLLPLRRIEGRDGRHWTLGDPQAFVRASLAGRPEFQIDYEHQSEEGNQHLRTGPIPAAGWIKELEVRADGIWGRVEWTARARELIGNREYRYLSPVFDFIRGTGRVTRFKSAGLTNHANLELTALSREENQTMTDNLRLIAGALDLAEDASADDIMQAINRRASYDPAKFVPIEAVAELMQDRNAKRDTMNEATATNRIDRAVEDGHLTPAMRDWATALCRQDPASFDRFLETSGKPYQHIGKRLSPSGAAPRGMDGADLGGDVQAMCRQLGLKPDDLR